jgi:outer membrane protein assembly factor BamB
MKERCKLRAGILAFLLLGFARWVHAQAAVPEATNLWSLKLTKNPSYSSPALAPDGTLYQATFDGTLLAITPPGQVRWTFDTGTETEIKSSPAIADDGTIYFGSRNRKFYAVTPLGKLKWTFLTGAWVDSSPAIAADGTVYFGSWDMNFYAVDPNGVEKWKFPVGAIMVSSPAVAADGTIYFGAFDKKLYALNADGKPKWTFATDGEITASPALGGDGTIYFASTDGNLYAVKSDGTERWHFHTGEFTEGSPVLDEKGAVYVPAPAGEYVVFPGGTGHIITGLACPVDGAAAAVAGRVYCSRPWRSLQAFHADGKLLWTANTALNLSAAPVVGPDGVVYATCETLLYAFRPVGDALPLAKSCWPMFRANPRHTGRVEN